MKRIKTSKLFFKKGNSDKVYEVDLCQVGSNQYVVNFRYGKRGANLREGVKTPVPVDLNEADEIFRSLVVAKTNKGYLADGDAGLTPAAPEQVAEPEPPPAPPIPPQGDGDEITSRHIILGKLHQACGGHSGDGLLSRTVWRVLDKIRGVAGRIDDGKLARVVWRAGELRIREAAPMLVRFIGRTDLLDYCIAWSLGRCNDTATTGALRQLLKHHGDNHVGRMAREALLSMGVNRSTLEAEITAQLPQNIQQALAGNNADALQSSLQALLTTQSSDNIQLLVDLYSLALHDSVVHTVMLQTMEELPLQPHIFKAIRAIYKTAEFRPDADMLGLILRRMETTHSRVSDLKWHYSYYKNFNKINAAFSQATKNYFKRRAWRMLRRLAKDDRRAFIDMASGILLAYRDSDKAPNFRSSRYQYSNRREQRVDRNFGAYAPFLALNHLLHQKSTRVKLASNRLCWENTKDYQETSGIREEAFPEIWNEYPDALLALLYKSRLNVVHQFAVKALRDNRAYCREIKTRALMNLLASPYTITAGFALDIARQRLDTASADFELLKALINSTLPAARELAQEHINRHVSLLPSHLDLLVSIIASPYEDVRIWSRQLVANAPLDDHRRKELIARLVASLMAVDGSKDYHATMLNDAAWVLQNVFGNTVRNLNLDIIRDMLHSEYLPLRGLAGKLLVVHETPAAAMPPVFFIILLETDDPQVRSTGIELLAKLPDTMLLEQSAMLAELATADATEVRRTVRPIIQRLSARDAAFARNLMDKLFPLVFRAEPHEGFHQDLIDLFKECFAGSLAAMDSNSCWRLLQAKSKAGQQLGAFVLEAKDASEFSVRQWARLGNHGWLSVRQWARCAFENHQDRIKSDMMNALRLLDAEWDDSRQFAFDYFRGFQQQDWTPETLVSICDSVRDDVQRCGRELIGMHFSEDDGAVYLMRLCEHPAANIQLFVTNYLAEYAAGNIERFEKLLHYFLTVLSHVNRNRIAKDRILTFLRDQSLHSSEAAQLILDMLERLSATEVAGDKANYIELLRDIQSAHPQLAVPINISEIPKRASAAVG